MAGDNIDPDKGTEHFSKERENVKLSYSYLVQVVNMFGFTGTDSITTENHNSYYTKICGHGVIMNTPLMIGLIWLHHLHPLNSLLLMYIC